MPEKFFVDMSWKGDRIRVFSDKTGKPLDSYVRADEVRDSISNEVKTHSFDPLKYIKAEASKFWAVNLLERFQKDKTKAIAPSYRRNYSRGIMIARAFFKTKDVRDIRKLDIINYIDYCRETYPEWSGKTLKNYIDLFKTFMNYLRNDLEVISAVPPFPDIDCEERTFKWVSADDQAKLFGMVPDDHKPIIAFLMLHGCQPGEARALKCKDVKLEQRFVTIAATFSDNVYRQRRKGKKAKALTIPIHVELYDFIADRVRSSHPEAFLFVNPKTGAPYSRAKINKIWKAVRTLSGIGPYELRLYDASRHSFASQLVNSGTTLFQVSKLLGHSSTKMSEKYSHADLEKLRTELSRISLKSNRTVTNLSPGKKGGSKTQVK